MRLRLGSSPPKSLAILLAVIVNVTGACLPKSWNEPASLNSIHQKTFIFDRIATSASAEELTSYLESLSLYILSSKDINLITMEARANLYDAENYGGQNVPYNKNNEKNPPCLTLSDDLIINSINTFNSCVRLYSDNHSCKGPYRIYTKYSHDRLNMENFRVRSVGSCNKFGFTN